MALIFNEPVQAQGSTIVVTAGSDVIRYDQPDTFGVDQTIATVRRLRTPSVRHRTGGVPSRLRGRSSWSAITYTFEIRYL